MIKFLFLILLLTSSWVNAQVKSSLRFEPIFGVEHAETRYPEPARMTTRATLGGRVLYGAPLLSSEFELSKAQGKREYPSQNITAKDDITRLMVGLRSTFSLTNFLGWYLRGGVRASKEVTEIEENGVKTTKEPPVSIDPYAGSGIQLSLGSFFSLNAGAAMIFTNNESKQSYDVQYTLGFSFHLGRI